MCPKSILISMGVEKLDYITNNCATAKIQNATNDAKYSKNFFNSITLNLIVEILKCLV